MFKTLKYLFLASLYNKAKKSFIILFIYLISLVLFIFVISDVMSIATGSFVYIVLTVKWIVIPIMIALISFTLLKIFNIASNPFDSQEVEKVEVKDKKKEKILAKVKLQTQSDLILQKYLKDK